MVPVLFCFLTACGPDTTSSTEEEEISSISLLCDPLPTEDATPRFAIYAQLAENKIKIGEIVSCDTILPQQYAEYNIPDGALTAIGGPGASRSDYIYVDRDSSKLRFFQAYHANDESVNLQWEQLAVYENGAIRAVFKGK